MTQQKSRTISDIIHFLDNNGNLGLKATCDEDTLTISSDDWKALNETEKQMFLLKYRFSFLSKNTFNWCPGLVTTNFRI